MSYPAEVTKYSKEISSEFEEYSLVEFREPKEFMRLLEQKIEDECLQLWIEDPEDFRLTPEKLTEIVLTITTQTHINSLMRQGLVDGVEDENGEMIYFPTEKGKELHKQLENEEA
jgi:hypothetical protein